MNRFYLGAFLVVLSAAGFGVMPVFALYAYQDGVSVATLLFLRFALAALLLFLYLFLKLKKIKLARTYLFPLFLLGGVFYPLLSTAYFSSVKYIPASLAVLLLYTYPVFVALLSVFLDKELLTRQILFSVALSFFGLTLVLGASFRALNFLGAFLAFTTAVTYACYITLGNRVVKQLTPVITSAFVILFASVSLFFISLFTGNIAFDFQARAWLPIGGLAFFSTVISVLTFFRGLEIIGSTRASVLSMMEPLVTIVFSALLFSERLTWLQAVGGLAVLSGSVLVVLTREQDKAQTPGARASGA